MRKFILLITLAAMLLPATLTPASADPISVAILGTVGITALTVGTTVFAIATAATTAALTFAASLGLQALMGALTEKPKMLSGAQTEVQLGGDIPRQILFGRVKTSGQFIYWKAYGESNKFLFLVFALADWECDAIEKVYVDGKECALNSIGTSGTEHARYEVAGYGSNLIVRFFRGTMTQSADSTLVTASGQTGPGLGSWTSAHKGAGVCYVSLSLTYDEDLFPSGYPRFEWQLRGAKLYDRRLDTTVGGSGSQRWNDPTTWAWSENVAVMEENFRRGFFRNGIRLVGMAQPETCLIPAYYVAAANVCDESLSEGGGTEKRYVCSAIVNDDVEWRVAIDTFNQAMAGYTLEKQGFFAVIPGAAQSVVGTFTDGDLLLGYDTTFAAKQPRSALVNKVYGSFINPAFKWQSESFAPVTDSSWLSEDNNELLELDLQLLMVPKRHQANRIAKIRAAEARLQATHTGVYGPPFAKFEPGDWVTLTNRFGSRTMRIVEREEIERLKFRFAMREIAASAYAGAATSVTPPVFTPPGDPVRVTAISGFTVTPDILPGDFGQKPVLILTWTPPADPGVIAVSIEFRLQGTTNTGKSRDDSPEDGKFVIQDNLVPGENYEVRARYLREPDIDTTWTSWILALTDNELSLVQSGNYEEDGNGDPIAGYQLNPVPGTVKAVDANFAGLKVSRRPIITASPIFRNGVQEGLPYQMWGASVNRSGAGISWSFDPDARFIGAIFHRTPDACYFDGNGTAKNNAVMGSTQLMYPVPTGQLLPKRMVMEAAGLADYAELRQDGSLHYIVLDGNGGIDSDNTFGAPWMSDLEIDPENRRGLTTIVGRLGITRGYLPFLVPEGYSFLRIALLGAGGGYDDSNSGTRGGPGGYLIFDLPTGLTDVVKPGDTLWFIIGEGGRPYLSGNTQGFGGGGQGDANRAQGGGATFCFHKDTSSRLNIIGVVGGGGAGEGSASGGPGGLTTSTNPSGGQSSGGDTMARCTGKDWDYSGSLKRAGGGGGYEGGITGGASGSNRGGRGGSTFANTAAFNLVNVSQAASAAGADGQAATNSRPSAASTKFSGLTTCLGTTFEAGEGADNSMQVPESAGHGIVMIELIA